MRSTKSIRCAGAAFAPLTIFSGCALVGPILHPPEIIEPPVSTIAVANATCPDISGSFEKTPYVFELSEDSMNEYDDDRPLISGHLLSRGDGPVRDADESELPSRHEVRLSQSEDRIVMETRHMELPRLFTDVIQRGEGYVCRYGYVEFVPRINNSVHEWGTFNSQEIARVTKTTDGDLIVYILRGPYRRTLTKADDDFTHSFFIYNSVEYAEIEAK